MINPVHPNQPHMSYSLGLICLICERDIGDRDSAWQKKGKGSICVKCSIGVPLLRDGWTYWTDG